MRAGQAVSRAIRLVSAVRGERVIHAKGRAYDGRLELLPGAQALGVPLVSGPATRPVLLRFSRGAGLPDVLPDVLGLAVRVPDADGAGHPQDLMLSTGARSGLRRHLPWPARDYLGATYSSLIRYDVGRRRLLIAALPDHEQSTTRVDDVEGGTLLLATAEGDDDWVPFARITVGAPLPPEQGRELGFEVSHDAGGLRIGGLWRAAREGAYAAARSVE